MMIGQSQ